MPRHNTITDGKIKKAILLIAKGVPKTRIYSYLNVSRRTILNWLSEGESALESEEELTDAEQRAKDFFVKVEKAILDYEMKNLAILEEHAETDWKAALKRLEISNPAVYNTRLHTGTPSETPLSDPTEAEDRNHDLLDEGIVPNINDA